MYLMTGRNIEKKYIHRSDCPLDVDEVKRASLLIDISHLRNILDRLSRGKWFLAFKLFKSYRIAIKSLVIILLKRFKYGKSFYQKLQKEMV